MKVDCGERDFRINIVRHHGQRALQDGRFLVVAVEHSVTNRDLLKREEVPWIELNRALLISCGLCPPPLTSLDKAHQHEYSGIIRQTPTRKSEFGQGAIVVEVSLIKIF